MHLNQVWQRLGIPDWPVVLAPLAGVSDHPFRRICQEQGADLTYVEMLSATAIHYRNKKTLEMMARHRDEGVLGVQVTGRNAEETAEAVAFLDKEGFETIDLNMGCPVKKVVQSGCGSAILKDMARLEATVLACRAETRKPFSVKTRIGWDRESVNVSESAAIIGRSGADWMTIHGRTRSDDYSVPVDLNGIAEAKRQAGIPVVGNGNIFDKQDADMMRQRSGVDGVMVSRGALGDPWVFRRIKGQTQTVTLEEWEDVVLKHISWQQEAYGPTGRGMICMRKHLLWYLRGWPQAKSLKEALTQTELLTDAAAMIRQFVSDLRSQGVQFRAAIQGGQNSSNFSWDPKFEMDRSLDRGVGHILSENA